MKENKEHWNAIYSAIKEKKPVYDLWLDRYKDILDKSKEQPIVDLGCGAGGSSLYLTERGYKVIACDNSEAAINIVNNFLPEVKTIQMDISKTLPFEDKSLEVIIAELSLHYFSEETTKNIMKEIKRVLKPEGHLIARVNSINDMNYGAGSGEAIEKNFYLTKDGYKRFFGEEDIQYYFRDFAIEVCEEKSILRYGNEKRAFEFVVRNL